MTSSQRQKLPWGDRAKADAALFVPAECFRRFAALTNLFDDHLPTFAEIAVGLKRRASASKLIHVCCTRHLLQYGQAAQLQRRAGVSRALRV